MIARRTLIAVTIAGAAASAARAQTAAPVVAFLGFASETSDRASVEALRQGFAKLGHVEGRTVRIVSRHAEGQVERVPRILEELLAMRVAVLVLPGQAAARMLRRMTQLPIVAVGLPPTPSDPDLFESLARPGGTVTGFSNFAEELSAKRIEMLREVLPQLRRIAILHNAADPVFTRWGVETEAAARAQGLEPVRFGLASADPEEAKRHVRAARAAQASGMIVIRDFLTHSARDAIYLTAIEERIATVTESREFAEAGALMSYGADLHDLFHRAAAYADRILRGESPAELPIQLATKLELVVNQRTARAIGVELPDVLLLRADEVIE
jgi:putative ABC transport system substrate-binding protein